MPRTTSLEEVTMLNNTTRTYPRTLRDSFPHDRVDYACYIERHKTNHELPLIAWAVLIVVAAVLAVAVVS